MSILSYSKDVTINGGIFTAVTTSPTQMGIDILVKASNPNAMHNSSARYDPPKCHPGTREAILEHIMQWIFGSDDRDALILWLYGPAGAGKSAILQSIAEKCAALDILLASFFFSRSDSSRDHPGPLIATIASQISARIPEMSTALHAAIVRDPMIFEKTLDAQIDLLIVEPLRHLVQSGYFAYHSSSPRLVLIDGLDECDDQGQRRGVLRAIARALCVHKLPFIFLVSSRPETDIRFSFDSAELADLWDSLVLDNSYTTRDDIRLFLTDSFQYIKETHPLKEHIPPSWPTSSVIDTLIAKSSGQFIYPSVIIQYISALNVSPRQQLDVVLGIRAARSSDVPFAEIDALYMHILSSVQDTQLMLDILAILMNYFFHIGQTRRSLDIAAFLGADQEDVISTFPMHR
ncbi:hypothetical protein HYPSUDRAFT_204702 [Hypholoma sublateritium FD-334 SS-4]|uniref:NACHT domain-containing protein n=1 Tax=Hypholoma sublateritium (strain FD-334 SS-4) TaxID=945553 RepID=A0A0D2M7T3_HYPSF|nr:hypothetical protein HYPSUDRAFT_204702 [Hypholoma sublateritium FD-334 SS-4]